MRRIIVTIVLNIMIVIQSLCQTHDAKAYDYIMGSVVKIVHPYKLKKVEGKHYEVLLKPLDSNSPIRLKENTCGTGFIVRFNEEYILVTAKHIAEWVTEESLIVFSNAEGRPHIVQMKDLTNFMPVKWSKHSDADVAAILMRPSYQVLDSISFNYVRQSIISDSEMAPKRHEKLSVAGFAFGLGANDLFAPATKTFYPASEVIHKMNFDGYSVSSYLLDRPSVEGFSGSPVFRMPQTYFMDDSVMVIKGVHLVGVMHGTVPDNTGGKFAGVAPASHVFKVIRDARRFSGVILYKYKDGNIWSEVLYKEGKPWEVIFNKGPDQHPQEKGTLKNGNGTRYVYSENGDLLMIEEYKNGKLLSK